MAESNNLQRNVPTTPPSPGGSAVDSIMNDFSKIKEYSDECLLALEDVLEIYKKKVTLKLQLEKLYKDYLKGFFDYISYTKSVMHLLGNKHEREYFDELDRELISRLQDLKTKNAVVFQNVYAFQPSISIRPKLEPHETSTPTEPETGKKINFKPAVTMNLSPTQSVERKTFRVTPEMIDEIKRTKKKAKNQLDMSLDDLPEKPKGVWATKPDEFLGNKTQKPQKLTVQDLAPRKKTSDVVAESIKNALKFEKPKESIFSEDVDLKAARAKKNKSSRLPILRILKSFFVNEEQSMFERSKDAVKSGWDMLLERLMNKQKTKHHDILSNDTVLSDRFKQLRNIRFSVKDESSYDLGLLTEQVKSDFFTNKPASDSGENFEATTMDYNVSSYGALSNILVKEASLELINAFPDFFKQLYHSLRLANVSILSNTYTNMMVLSTFIVTGLGFVLSFLFSIIMNPILPTAIANGIFFSIMSGAITFVGFLSYPHYKIKKREQDIKTNLPFAIDHMSAVVSSGVAPAAMFKLIVSSKEYGEITKEIEKVVEYIDLFGYDLLTAIETVAQLSPSDDLKEFFEGFISTVESGGDLKSYLREKAEGTMVQYKLERQKYTDIISTFSDVYTGIMVASPLFFVAALSLISILGGGVGGVDINIIVVLGTYVFIPVLNGLFMIFIELSQPNV
jgi:pilus assembly protein TadC